MRSKSDQRYLDQANWRSKGHIEFFSWPAPPPSSVPLEVLHELSLNDKQILFEDFKPTQEAHAIKGKALLAKLEHLDPVLAAKFELKPDLIQSFIMRLINGEESPERSYIALSYCWSPQYQHLTKGDINLASEHRIPLSGLLFQAAIAERNAANEGVWIDQLCIDQKNREEKKIAIAAMDAVYKHARSVFVALEDIEVNQAEQLFMLEFIPEFESSETILSRPHFGETPAYMERNTVLRDFFTKITSSRWFTRAWCSHEMRLGQKHTFYIPCEATGPHNKNLVLGLTGEFLWYLCSLSSEVPSVNSRNLDVKGIIARNFDMQKQIIKIRRIMNDQPGDVKSDGADYVANIMETFELDAGGDPDLPEEARIADANCDKISIVLNILGNGLNLKIERSAEAMKPYASLDECYRQLLILALAAGDPLSLCCLGRPLKPNTTTARSSWLCQPTNLDTGSAPELHSLPVLSPSSITLDPNPESTWIELDGYSPTKLDIPSETSFQCAKQLLNKCISLNLGLAPGGIISVWGPGPEYQYWRYQTDLEEDMLYRFLVTLQLVLHAGLQWTLKVSENSGFPPNKLAAWKKELLEYFHEEFNMDELIEMKWVESEAGVGAVNALMRFVNWIVTWGQQSTHAINSSEIWMPRVYKLDSGGKVLIFSDPFTSNDKSLNMDPTKMSVFIPECLVRDEYSRLARVWILNVDEKDDEKKEDDQDKEIVENLGKDMDRTLHISTDARNDDTTINTDITRWVLKRKTRLFSDKSISTEKRSEWERKDQMRIYGSR
ncbi:hypothetical protein B7463_g7816, partial [Scytalidium lignicola]